jgi:hypothetical protein
MFSAIILFLTYLSIVSAENQLRVASPHPNERAAAAVARLSREVLQTVTVGPERISNKIRKMSSSSKALQTIVDPPGVIKNGYFIERARPNSDCSGVTALSEGNKLGACKVENGMSFYYACGREIPGTKVVPIYTYNFYNSDCSGEPNMIQQMDMPKCEIDYSGFKHVGFRSEAIQCSAEMDKVMDEPMGIITEVLNTLLSTHKLLFTFSLIPSLFLIFAYI